MRTTGGGDSNHRVEVELKIAVRMTAEERTVK